jgi:hypothetical protein
LATLLGILLENKMKTSLVFLVLSLIPSFAFSDDFNCDSSASEHLHVHIQNNENAALGTRTAAVLLVTDTEAQYGSRTLVGSKTVVQNGAFWTVDTSDYSQTGPDKQIGDFDREELSKLQVYIPSFNFNEANKDGQEYAGHLFLFQAENTETFSQDVQLTCVYNTK